MKERLFLFRCPFVSGEIIQNTLPSGFFPPRIYIKGFPDFLERLSKPFGCEMINGLCLVVPDRRLVSSPDEEFSMFYIKSIQASPLSRA